MRRKIRRSVSIAIRLASFAGFAFSAVRTFLARLLAGAFGVQLHAGGFHCFADQSQSFLTGRSDSIHTRPFHHTYLNWCATPN